MTATTSNMDDANLERLAVDLILKEAYKQEHAVSHNYRMNINKNFLSRTVRSVTSSNNRSLSSRPSEQSTNNRSLSSNQTSHKSDDCERRLRKSTERYKMYPSHTQNRLYGEWYRGDSDDKHSSKSYGLEQRDKSSKGSDILSVRDNGSIKRRRSTFSTASRSSCRSKRTNSIDDPTSSSKSKTDSIGDLYTVDDYIKLNEQFISKMKNIHKI